MNNTKNKEKKITVVVTGGGTGGHIYPAIAVAKQLKHDEKIKQVFYIGCGKNLEYNVAQKEKFEFLSISISGMPRKSILNLCKWSFVLAFSVIQSLNHLRKIKPNVIFGTGGYVSGPVLIAAFLLRIPFVIHDSDARPGIVSRVMSPFAKTVSISFDCAKMYLKSSNTTVNGNPVRTDLVNTNKEQAFASLNLNPNKKTLFIMGGSQGAKRINYALLDIVEELVVNYDLQVIHQTGAKNYETFLNDLSAKWSNYNNHNSYIVKPFFENMDLPYATANIAIARAGSLSISELNLTGIPSILVPYPHAAADHQRFNARAMEKAGAAFYLEDSECTGENLKKILANLLRDEKKLAEMKRINLELAKPNATNNLAMIVKEAALKSNQRE